MDFLVTVYWRSSPYEIVSMVEFIDSKIRSHIIVIIYIVSLNVSVVSFLILFIKNNEMHMLLI